MGCIYAPEAVALGQVPTRETITHVAAQVRQVLAEEPSIEAAVICGSVIRADHTRRSDIDVVVVFHDGNSQAWDTMHHLTCLSARHSVTLSFIPVSVGLACSRMHQLGRLFQTHVRAAIVAGGAVKGDCLNLLAETINEHEESSSYVRSKVYNLHEGWSKFYVESEEWQLSYLKKVLEMPLHIARRVLQLQVTLNGDGKAHVIEQYPCVVDGQLVTQFNQLLNIDSEYSALLEMMLVQYDDTRYRAGISNLVKAVPLALTFATQNAYVLEKALQKTN